MGNDFLNGGAGNDTYIFSKGDGADTIIDFDQGYWVDNFSQDILQFTDIKSTDVTALINSGSDLIMQFGYPL